MSTLNVLITSPIEEEYLHQIAAVDPEIKIFEGTELAAAEARGDMAAKKKLDDMLAQAEVIYVFRPPENIIKRAPMVKWIHTGLAGVDRILDADIINSPVILTNGKGAHTVPVAEVALEMMMMFAKKAPLSFQLKQEKKWQRFSVALLRYKTVGIVGLGSIGGEIARLSRAFGMRVIATRRSAKQESQEKYVDRVLPANRLLELLADSDFVVLALPLTSETDKLIGETEIRAMKPTSYLINIGRGRTIDEEALILALEEDRIAGAGLDTFAKEPLPVENRLWELPNVIYSPHISGGGENVESLVNEGFRENLKLYLEGKKLLNIVDKKRGY